jgi:hypothetical protein
MVITEEGTSSCQPTSPIAVSLRTHAEEERCPPMSLGELLASIREHRRDSAHQSTEEEGAQISRRVLELLAVPTPTQEVETPSINARSENDPACVQGRQH